MNISSYQHIGDSSVALDNIGRVVGLVRWLDHTNTQTEKSMLKSEVKCLKSDAKEVRENVHRAASENSRSGSQAIAHSAGEGNQRTKGAKDGSNAPVQTVRNESSVSAQEQSGGGLTPKLLRSKDHERMFAKW